ncbi:MAG: FAD-dependent oxidoreductase [Anaerolineae bacterium]|nr:FAD-dependent oxidoreductase [Anaerolineae bacterium]
MADPPFESTYQAAQAEAIRPTKPLALAEVPRWDHESDVVIVGLGGAGASAAIEARQLGADVLVLERASEGGGSTALSGGIIYFGGGTPTELTPAQLKRILDALRRTFDVTPHAEITLEGVARQMLAPDYLAACLDAGFNRISFGVQSLNPHVRSQIGRGDRVEEYLATVELAKSLKADLPINLDMMAGLPGQTPEILQHDLETIITWPIDSVDVLYYVMMPGTLLQKMIKVGRRGGPQYGPEMLHMRTDINDLFRRNGFSQVTGEVFTRADRDLFTYTSFGSGGNRLNTVLALGPSAFGLLNSTVYHNVADLGQYMQAVGQGLFPIQTAAPLTPAIAQRRALLLSILQLEIPDLLLSGGVLHHIRRWEQQGLIDRVPGGYRLNEQGALWYNHMQMDLLPFADLMQLLRFFGSTAEHNQMLRTSQNNLKAHERELLALIRSKGKFGSGRLWLFRSYMLFRQLPLFDQAALGFTGRIGDD